MFLAIFYIKQFYETNYFYKLILIYCKLNYYNINSAMAGITSLWQNFVLLSIEQYLLAFSINFLSTSLFIKFNFRLYFKKAKTKRNMQKSTYFSKIKFYLIKQLILISFCKLVLVYIIYFALKTKPGLKLIRPEVKRLNFKAYFLSPEYFKDIYQLNDDFMRHLHKWHCLSKLKLTSFKSFYQTLLLLSGDIALNPGPTSFPCSKCSKGVRVGVLCTNCDMWIHKTCEGLSSSQMTKLSKNQTEMSKFVCIICKENMENLTSNENDLPANEISFQFQEEHLQDISLDDPTQIFKNKGLHFLHLNCNNLPSKIDEIR